MAIESFGGHAAVLTLEVRGVSTDEWCLLRRGLEEEVSG